MIESKTDIEAIAADGEVIDDVMQEVGRQEMLRRKRLGLSVVIWRDGEVVTLSPDEIPEDGIFTQG